MKSEQGIALIIVMWVLVALMVVVLSFSYVTKVEVRIATAFKEGMEEKFIAEAGIDMAAVEIMYRKINLGAPAEDDRERAVWKADGTPNLFRLDSGTGLVRIIDESGKVDLNKSSEIVIKGLLISLGIKDEDASVISDSIQDWRDADDFTRLNGAEDDYYQSLPAPYKAKNADFESIEELLLVRGVTAEIFYGKAGRPGLADFVTVYSESGRINLSAAPKEVLLALPGMTPEMAGAIIEFRNRAGQDAGAGIQGITGPAYAGMSPFVTAGESNTYTVEAVGRKGPQEPGYGVKAVISVYGNKYSFRYYRSPWDMTKWKEPEQVK